MHVARQVRLWNRGDCCSDGLRNFKVELCDDPTCAESVHGCADADAWHEPVPPYGVANIK